MRAHGLVAVTSFLLSVGSAGAQHVIVRAEPGVARESGGALLPFVVADSSGVPFPVRPGELTVETDAGEALAAELVSFVGPGAEASALHVLVDPAALRGQDLAGWAAELASFLQPSSGAEAREAAVAGARFVPIEGGTATEIRPRLEGNQGPFWDRTLTALDRLSGPGPPARRVLLLITNGEEARESRHPAATCADAADSARVCVWALVPGTASPAARSRLASVAARSGGAVVEAGGRGAAALPTVLARIRAAQALRLPRLPAPPPLSLTLRPALASASPARVWVRTRRALGLTARPFPWLPFAGALVAALAVGGIVVARHLPVGRVHGITGLEGGMKVTRAGLTIGGAVGNGLVVADPRVSRSHAVIRLEKGCAVLMDLRSANGTKVNGRPISSVVLRNGDRIVLADAVELVWEEGGFRFGKRR